MKLKADNAFMKCSTYSGQQHPSGRRVSTNGGEMEAQDGSRRRINSQNERHVRSREARLNADIRSGKVAKPPKLP